MGILDFLFKSKFDRWLESATFDELKSDYERRRQDWLKNGAGDKPRAMDRINDEIITRMNEQYRREHPNSEPRHREHGWYLPNDD